MAEIKYHDFKAYLKKCHDDPKQNPLSSIYLIHGEELLYKTALDRLLDLLVPGENRQLHYEAVDGDRENMVAVVEKVNTFSLLSGPKVVAIVGSKIFYSKKDTLSFAEKAKVAFDDGNLKKAAGYILDLIGMLSLTFGEISAEDPCSSLKLDPEQFGDGNWLKKIIAHCNDNGLPIPERQNHADFLKAAVEKGFPKGNYLIITTDMVDKRRSLYRTLSDYGTVVDCAIPRGDRRGDRLAQDAVLAEHMVPILKNGKKTMGRVAYQALVEMTGFDLRTFANNLEKLVSYVGDRKEITVDDVETVLRRTKKDPIYELTNALADRNTERSLFFIASLLDDGIHPLQILAACTNQVRRLLLVKDFVLGNNGQSWQPGLSFDQFKRRIMPAIVEHDRSLLEWIDSWQATPASKSGKKNASKKRKPKTDLLVAKNPKNPYPVFLMLRNSEKFTQDELVAAMKCLNEADLQLKSSPVAPRLVIEKTVIEICAKA